MEDTYKLKLSSKIDLCVIKKILKNKKIYRPINQNHFEEDQEIVYTIIHKYSNYENVIWSIYKKNSPEFIHDQLKEFLLEISKLDHSLTWACMKILSRYKRQYSIRKMRSSYVYDDSLNSNKLCI